MNIRIQTYGLWLPTDARALWNAANMSIEGTTVYDVLEKGFDDLMGLCDVVTEKFTEARDDFNARQKP